MAIVVDNPELESRLGEMAGRMGEPVEEVVAWILIEECDRAEKLSQHFESDSGAATR